MNITVYEPNRNEVARLQAQIEELKRQNQSLREELHRRDAETCLCKNDGFFQNLVDTAPALLWVTGPDNSCIFLSRGWFDFTGQTEESGLGSGWLEALHPEDRERVGQIFTEASERREPFVLDYRLRHVDGTYRWAIDTGRPHYAVDGTFLGYVGSVIDITERKSAEEALGRYKLLAEHSRDIILFLELEGGRVLEANTAAELAYGYSREELLSMSVSDLRAPEARGPIQDQLAEADSKGLLFQTIHCCKDGSVFPVEVSSRGETIGGRRTLVSVVRNITERKKIEDALRESESRLKTIIENLAEGLIVIDPKGSTLQWNRAALEMHGYQSHEEELSFLIRIVDRYELNTLEGKIVPYEEWPVSRLLRGETLRDYELRVKYKPKDWERIFSYGGVLIQDSNGQPQMALLTIRDVTDRKRAEEALLISQADLNRAQAVAQTGSWRLEVRHNRLIWSDETYKLFGIQKGSPLSYETFLSAVHPDDRDSVNRKWQEALQGQLYDVEHRILVGGSIKWMREKAELEFDENGGLLGGFGTVQDITERKQALEALRESEERFRTLADNISQLVWMTDESGWIFWYNRRWFEFTGTTLEEMEGWGWKKVHHPEHVERVTEKFRSHVQAGKVWEDVFPLRNREGEYRWFLSRAIPIRDGNGKVTRWFGTNTDITAQREAEESLREADRRKDEFLAILGHELRNPLAAVHSALQLLKRPNQKPEKEVWIKGIIEEQIGQLGRIVDDLLDVSRIVRGKIRLNIQDASVTQVVEKSMESIREMCVLRKHELTVNWPNEELFIAGDPVRLQQILVNLLSNACKYTPEGGCIGLAVEAAGDTVLLRVSDNGLGIPFELQAKIFELFAQVESEKHKSQGGLGIGLSLVKMLTELHKGSITLHSEGEGRGSEFVVRLPRANRKEPHPPMMPQIPAAEVIGLQVLLVEDNLDLARLFADTVEEHGHSVRTIHNGLEAVEAARKQKPDVVLLDIGLPGIDGYELARRLRRDVGLADTLIVATTAWGQDRDRARSAKAGIDLHLVKPVDFSQVKQAIAEWHARRKKDV